MILGIDVYEGYGKIDWARVAASGVRFAFIKSTEGNEGKDRRFDENVAGAKAVGIYVGAYLYAFPLPDDPKHPGRSPIEQARRFWFESSGLGTRPGELPPVLDFEWPVHFERVKGTSQIIDKWAEWKVSPASMVAWAEECVEEIERLWGRTPLLYTFPDFARSLGGHLRDSSLGRCPLWMAHYTHPTAWMPPDDARPIVPAPWSDWTFWQFSADGSSIRVPGVPACPLDRNVFRGDLDGLRRLANINPDAETVRELPSVVEADDEPEGTVIHRLEDFRKVYTPPPLRGQEDDEPNDAA